MDPAFTVRQTVERTGVKSYVLRYWEEELGLDIRRNEQGHRYYTEEDIQLFIQINGWKTQGLQLKAIKELMAKNLEAPQSKVIEITKLQDERLEKSEKGEGKRAKRAVSPGKIMEFSLILERLIAQEIQSKNEEEEKCRSLDLAIRKQQQARKEAAVSKEKNNRKKKIE